MDSTEYIETGHVDKNILESSLKRLESANGLSQHKYDTLGYLTKRYPNPDGIQKIVGY
jgi:hypothetical protein